MLTFIAEKHAKALEQQQLHTFWQLWNHQIEWFEAPNERRGGWSGVGRIQLHMDENQPLFVFVKKQKNHGRLTLRHPFKGEPTFRREYLRLQYLANQGVAAPQVVFYAEDVIEGKLCAVLVTKELAGYQALDTLADTWFANGKPLRKNRQRLIKSIAESLRNFHQLGLVHRALYPKHIFVKDADSQAKIALIDLEKARFSPFFWYRAYFDLAALNRHAEHWSRTDRLYFFKQYSQQSHLGKLSKWLCRRLIQRSQRK